MLIDWFTVIAQIVNFLILVALLKHFLYGRIIKAMDERERKIASNLEEAEKERERAELEATSYRKKNQEIDERSKDLFSRAREEAEKERKELIQRAREEINDLQGRWREALRQERESFLQELRRQLNDQVFRIARRAMKDLANADLEGQIIHTFLDRLKNLGEEEKKAIASSVGKAGEQITVLSAFEITSNDRQRITQGMRSHIAEGIEVAYQTPPDMIMGIELRGHGHKLAWSLDHYLASLETSLGLVLEGETKETSQKGQGERRIERAEGA